MGFISCRRMGVGRTSCHAIGLVAACMSSVAKMKHSPFHQKLNASFDMTIPFSLFFTFHLGLAASHTCMVVIGSLC